MIDYLEALAALADRGTMRRAALSLHISQSAVSKRIAALEGRLGKKLVEPSGRKVMLTPTALRLLEKARPLVGEIKELLIDENAEVSGTLVMDLSVSVLISWGAAALAKVKQELPGLVLEINANHASV